MSTRPSLRQRLLQAWLEIAMRFGEVQTLVLLGLFYAFLIGPAALGVRLARRDLLARRGLREGGSAWRDAELVPHDLERAKLQS
jgi:hypothetical protein